MRINRKHVRKVSRYVHPTLSNQYVRVIATIDDLGEQQLARIDLVTKLAEGESYLPPPISRFSRFNAEGKWVTRRNEPKEKRYITTLRTAKSEFRGRDRREDVESTHDVYRMCYPRDLIPPPEEEVFGFPIDNQVYAATEALSLPAEEERLQHQVNLLLELFGSCEVVRADGQSASPARTHRRWTFLPSGSYKQGTITTALGPLLAKLRPGDRMILTGRQEILDSFEPQEIAQGEGGFSDYLAYVFPQYGRVVLESLRRDNAIYVFKGAWEAFSRLTKRQIIDSGVHDARIVHSTGWQQRLQDVLGVHH